MTRIYEGHAASVFPVLFVGLFPVANALVDWLSINISRHVLKFVSEVKLKLKTALMVIFGDLLLAFLLCALLFFLLIGIGEFIESFGGSVEASQINNKFDGAAFGEQLRIGYRAKVSGFSWSTA